MVLLVQIKHLIVVKIQNDFMLIHHFEAMCTQGQFLEEGNESQSCSPFMEEKPKMVYYLYGLIQMSECP